MQDKKILIWLFKVFFMWRLLTLFFAYLAIKLIIFKPSFPYWESILKPYGSPLFWSWANFDGVHYLGIAKNGYFAQYTQAFFPFYPLLVRWSNFLFNNLLFGGLFISHFSFMVTLYFLYKIIILDFSEKVAKKTIIFFTFFPTSFYFASFYTESLFMCLLLASFYCLRKEKLFFSGFLGALASFTRLIGILIIPAFLWETIVVKKKKNFLSLISCFLPLIGLSAYMFFLQKNFADALYFLHAQPFFGASRSDKIVLLYQVFWRYFKMFLSVKDPLVYFNVSLEFFITVLFLILLILVYKKKLNNSYLIFSILAYILPTLTGTFSSMPRYVLVLFPCFMALGLVKKKRDFFLLLFFSGILLMFCTMLFIRGYWVA